jgi:UDP-2-acetamido-2,6-beta-L-arabino-hexul-4-ose reductase
MKTVLVTGAEGFVGRNLCLRLRERGDIVVAKIVRGDGGEALADAAGRADFVFHLAGINRPSVAAEFALGNPGFTETLCETLAAAGSRAPIVFSSSTQAAADNPYGRSKREAEDVLLRHGEATGTPVYVFRLTNVFGKWARPDYNSAVATFCHNIARGGEITVFDPDAALDLVYIDDVIESFIRLLDDGNGGLKSGFHQVAPIYSTTVGDVADIIRGFPGTRQTMVTPPVGTGLIRALYSTYLTYLTPADFAYSVPVHADPRGVFVEMLKTIDSGQFSYFTAGPGVTRGEHYHHSKTEKFLIVAGSALFRFRHVDTGETHEIIADGRQGRIVETVPGWTHNIANIGNDELVVMLWANEIYRPDRPDTIAMQV